MKKIFAALLSIFLVAVTALADQPIKVNESSDVRRRVPIILLDEDDGITPINGATISGSECALSKNGGSESVCSGSVVEVAQGIYYYQIAIAEADTLGYLTVRITDTGSDALTFYGKAIIVAYDPYSSEQFLPARGTAQAVTGTTIRLAAAETFADDELNFNTAVHVVSAAEGAGQTRCVIDYAASNDQATVETWTTTPSGTITYSLFQDPHCAALMPNIAGNKVDVSNAGNVALNWGDVEAPTTVVGLTGTTISTSQQVASVSGAVGSVTGSVGSVTGSVGSVTGNVGGTINGLTATALADFFDTNSTTTYASAVAGSVVEEIASNSGGTGDVTIHTGTAQSIPANNQIRLAAGETYGNDVLKGNASILILSSSGATSAVGQTRCVKSNVASTDLVALYENWKVNPAGTVTYAVLPTPNCDPDIVIP